MKIIILHIYSVDGPGKMLFSKNRGKKGFSK